MTVGIVGGAATNAGLAIWVASLGPALALRFATGMCLAGAYPPAMKIMATWFREGRGLAIGILVGALTVGSAAPHLVSGLTTLPGARRCSSPRGSRWPAPRSSSSGW